jgi:hypothetical protein
MNSQVRACHAWCGWHLPPVLDASPRFFAIQQPIAVRVNFRSAH